MLKKKKSHQNGYKETYINTIKTMYDKPRVSLVAQQQRICLQCWRLRRCRFDPWIGKILDTWIHGGHGNPLQYSCLENPKDRGAWQATVHRVAQSQTQQKRLSTAQYKPITNIILNSEKLKALPQKLGIRQECPLLLLLFNTVLTFLTKTNRQEKEIQAIQMRKEEINCVYLQISYIEYP